MQQCLHLFKLDFVIAKREMMDTHTCERTNTRPDILEDRESPAPDGAPLKDQEKQTLT